MLITGILDSLPLELSATHTHTQEDFLFLCPFHSPCLSCLNILHRSYPKEEDTMTLRPGSNALVQVFLPGLCNPTWRGALSQTSTSASSWKNITDPKVSIPLPTVHLCWHPIPITHTPATSWPPFPHLRDERGSRDTQHQVLAVFSGS